MTNLPALKQLSLERWHRCEILPNRLNEVMATGRRLCAADAKARYQGVSDRLAELAAKDPKIVVVPWWFTAIVSEREYGGPPHWNKQLGQGDDLHQISRHVPRGMGPYLDHPGDRTPGFDAWTRCCVDVLANSPPFAARRTDWSIGGALVSWILYNGTGYEDFHHEASPYDWGATTIEQWGKYVADGRFDPHVWDTQIGCAAMLKAMMMIDPTIKVDESGLPMAAAA
jgi:lysozyme family protein